MADEKKELMIGEEEVRNYVRRPMCPSCHKLGAKRYCVENTGQIVVGPQERPMTVWECTHCNYNISLPPGAFPSMGFQIVTLEGPPPPKGHEQGGN